MTIPNTLPWIYAFSADQPGFTPPADGEEIPTVPTNLGSGGTFDSKGFARWVDNVAGTGKPAIRTVGSQGITRFVGGNSIPDRTFVAVGRALGADSDIWDTSTGRSLLDNDGTGFWRMYAGSNASDLIAADTEMHLFIGYYAASENETLHIDAAKTVVNAGANSGGGNIMFGFSNLGIGNNDGTELAFIGIIDRELTQQEKDDLYAWYLAEYFPADAGAAPKVGTLTQVGGYVGSTPVLRAYLGEDLVFGTAP